MSTPAARAQAQRRRDRQAVYSIDASRCSAAIMTGSGGGALVCETRRSERSSELRGLAMPGGASIPLHLDAVLEGLAENPALPAVLIRRMLAQRRGFGQVAKRPGLTANLISEIIATEYHWLLHSLVLNPALPDSVRLQLSAHRDAGVRAALVVGGSNAGRELFERLVDDSDKRVRKCLAKGDTVPADLRARLAHDPDAGVRATLARWWPQAPEEARRILLTDPVDEVRAAACSTYYARTPHPIPPADLVPGLLGDPVTRAGAVRHADLTAETAQRLAGDPDNKVRRELAAHPQLPPSLRDRLAEDPSAYVRVGVFARSDTPEPTRRRIYDGIQQGSRGLANWLNADLDDEAAEQAFMDEFASTELRHLCLAWVTCQGSGRSPVRRSCDLPAGGHQKSLLMAR